MEYAILQDHKSMRYYIVPYEDVDCCTETCDACGESDWFITSFNISEDVSRVMDLLLDYGLFSVIEEVLSYFKSKRAKDIALDCLGDYKYETEVRLNHINEAITTVRKMERN